MEWREIVGAIAVFIAFISVIPYIMDILKGKVKPHTFSWLVWGTVTAIAFAAQLSENAGAGAWVTGWGALKCAIILILSLFWGEKTIARGDVMSLSAALFILPIWAITHNAFWAVFLASLIDIVGFYPTIRKSWRNPFQESGMLFFYTFLSVFLSLLALTNYSLTNVFYLAAIAAVNLGFTLMLLWRRAMIKDAL